MQAYSIQLARDLKDLSKPIPLQIIGRSHGDRLMQQGFIENKQYNYLFVCALEGFIDLLEGLRRKLPKVANKKNKSSKSNKLCSSFESRFESFRKVCRANGHNINLRFELNVAEMIRHIIVHEQGVVNDMQKFKAKIFKKSGMQDKANNEIYLKAIDDYFYPHDETCNFHNNVWFRNIYKTVELSPDFEGSSKFDKMLELFLDIGYHLSQLCDEELKSRIIT